MLTIQNILVPVDFTEAAAYAAVCAADLARIHKAKLYVLHVKEPFPAHGRIVAGSFEDVQRQRIKKEQIALPKLIPSEIKSTITAEEIQVTGTPIDRVIVEKAQQLNVDVIVMVVQKRKRWLRFFKKNILEQVLQDAPCAVLAVSFSQSPFESVDPLSL